MIKKRIQAYETEIVVIVWTFKIDDKHYIYEQEVRIPPKETLKVRVKER